MPAAVGSDIVPLESDPALHTVQTVGRLSAVAARRVWANLSARVQQLRANGEEPHTIITQAALALIG